LAPEELLAIAALAKARVDGTFYDILGLAVWAPQAEVEQAYHELVRKWHPDRFYSRETGEHGITIEENFVAATRAFRTLRDPAKRKTYNRDAEIEEVEAPAAAQPRHLPPKETIDLSTFKVGATSPGGTPIYESALLPGARQIAPPPKPRAPPEPPKPRAPPAVDRIRQKLAEQLSRARSYYEAGKADFDAGRFTKAEATLYLAVQFDPRCTEYAELHQKAVAGAREGRAKGFLALAEQEESYQRVKEAIGWYQKATECDPPDGAAFFRLGRLQLAAEKDARAALGSFRKAVGKEPRNTTFRVALCELYISLGMQANAIREAQAAIEIDPRHEVAKGLLKGLRK
jgi:tetratricopeptide (TPR) repeat protein